MALISPDALLRTSGQVTHSEKFNTSDSPFERNSLAVLLQNQNQYFYLGDSWEKNFAGLQKNFAGGESITIYSRHRWQSILGMGRHRDIYHITKGDQILFDISLVKSKKVTDAVIFALFSLVLWIWYLLFRWSQRGYEQKQL